MILRLFEENPCLSLRGGHTPLRKNGVIVSCDNIRRPLLAHDVKFRSTRRNPFLSEKHAQTKIVWAKVLFGHRHAWSTHAKDLSSALLYTM